VIAICGDGGFMMNSQEVETAVRLGLDVVVVILNDRGYGMIKWKQQAMKFSNWGLDFGNPDFVLYAKAYGASGHRIDNAAQLLPKLKECLAASGVHIIDVAIDYSENKQLTRELKSLACEVEGDATQNVVAPKEDTPTSAAEKLEVKSPFNRALVATLDMQSEAEVEAALAKAKALFDNRDGWLPTHQRIAILEKLALLMEQNREQLIQTSVSEGGKPYTDSAIEMDRAIQGVKLGVQAMHALEGKQVAMGLTKASSHRLATTVWEPIGVVASLSAFNHPINLTIHQVVPAIAAGCPVIIKPAPATPMTCLAIVKLLAEAGLPQGWCQTILCNNALAEKLSTDKRVGYLSFIGSAKVGWYLRSKLAPGTRCALEHGGAAPVIVDDTADLKEVIPSVVKGGFYHAGQVCVSVQRIFVSEKILDTFVAQLTEAVKKLKVGDPAAKDTEVGPLIRPQEVDRMVDWVNEAVTAGAKLACGGTKISETFYAPTVLVNPPQNVKVSSEEVFGPLVCVYGYKELNEAVRLANSLPVAFQSSIFTKNVDVALETAQRLNATAVMINDHTAFRVDWMPFGGRDVSGIGMGGIEYSTREMSREKLIVFKSDKLQ
jgi:acyl-CoA reductase-like NAD-dependent aldehyde dehydrogenase